LGIENSLRSLQFENTRETIKLNVQISTEVQVREQSTKAKMTGDNFMESVGFELGLGDQAGFEKRLNERDHAR
jgi:hypothetical protein